MTPRALLAAFALVAAILAGGAAAVAQVGNLELYRFREGDTLWTIAADKLGDPTLWPALYLANRDQIKDPARVYPGQELAIPEVDPAERTVLRREAEALLK